MPQPGTRANFSPVIQKPIGYSPAEAGSATTTRVTGATYTTLQSDGVIFYNTDAQASALTLEAGSAGRTIKIINSGTSGNPLTIDGDGTEPVIGETTVFTLCDGETLILTYNTTDGWM
jgi:hypothetical protein